MPKDRTAEKFDESKAVRLICFGVTAACWLWLMVAISADWSFWAPLVGTAIGFALSLPMYLSEQESARIRESKRVSQGQAERKGDTTRWEVDDRGRAPRSEPAQPPTILES